MIKKFRNIRRKVKRFYKKPFRQKVFHFRNQDSINIKWITKTEIDWILHIYKNRVEWFDFNSKNDADVVQEMMKLYPETFSIYML